MGWTHDRLDRERLRKALGTPQPPAPTVTQRVMAELTKMRRVGMAVVVLCVLFIAFLILVMGSADFTKEMVQ